MRFSSDFCAASAIASPPMPRPASVAFTLNPNIANAASEGNDQHHDARESLHEYQDRLPASALRSCPLHRVVEASVSDRAGEPHETSHQERLPGNESSRSDTKGEDQAGRRKDRASRSR